MNDYLLQKIIQTIALRLGLNVREEDHKSLSNHVRIRMKARNASDAEEYLSLLSSDTSESRTEWKELVILITTGETYFFRDRGHFSLLKNKILPELIERRRARRFLRIWSAGCSTGEEPYSLAILLDMLLPDLKGWDIVIQGTDVNENSIDKARRGIYSPWSFRMVDKDIQRKYFTRHSDDWEIDESIKNMVRFQYGNIMDAGFFSQNPEIGNVDIIICRNVFIYFEKEAVTTVLNGFLTRLNDEGYLITGHGELHGQDLTNLRQIMYPEAVLYKKPAMCKGQASELARLSENTKKIADVVKPGKRVSRPVMPVQRVKAIKPQDTKTETEKLIRADKTTCNQYQYKDTNDMLYLMARTYANAGDYEKAESVCREAAKSNADSADPYFLLAHIAEARGNDEAAKEYFKKAIYLDPAFIAAYCELGGLYDKENDLLHAKKVRSAAVELLTALPPQAPVKPYDITAEELLAYARDLIGPGDKNLAPTGTERNSGR